MTHEQYRVQRIGSKGSCVYFGSLSAARKFVAGTKYPTRLEIIPITHRKEQDNAIR